MSLDAQFLPNNTWPDLNSGLSAALDPTSLYPNSQIGLIDGYSSVVAPPIPTSVSSARVKTTALKRRLNTSKSSVTDSVVVASSAATLNGSTPTVSNDYKRATSATSTTSSLSPSGLGAVKAPRRGRSRSHNTTKETSDEDSRSNEDKELERRTANNTRER